MHINIFKSILLRVKNCLIIYKSLTKYVPSLIFFYTFYLIYLYHIRYKYKIYISEKTSQIKIYNYDKNYLLKLTNL
jgi:hypothetical protein